MDARRLIALLCAVALPSCSSASREEMSSAVLQSDPAFATVLEQRNAIEQQVDDVREQLTVARINAEQQIRGIQREFRDTRTRLQRQMDALSAQLQPERDRLSLEIKTTQHDLRTQEALIQGLKKTAADLQQALVPAATATPPPAVTLPPTGAEGSIGITTAQERAATEAHLGDVQHQLQAAQRALDEARHRLKLLQYKFRLLRIE